MIARALAKEPEDRYADTRELAQRDQQGPRAPPARTARRHRAVSSKAAKPPIALSPRPRSRSVQSLVCCSGAEKLASPLQRSNARVVEPDRRTNRRAAQRQEMLIVTSEPPGATVEIDGAAQPETTPIAKRGVSIGKHTIKMTRKGYGAVERTVAIAAGDRKSLEVQLPPKSRMIHVRTIPTGAAVFLENELVSGSTPADVTVQVDEFYSLRVEKLGFEPLTKNITPDDTETEIELRLDEEKQPMGYLWIDTNGVGDVWIDGRDTGFTAPDARPAPASRAHTPSSFATRQAHAPSPST